MLRLMEETLQLRTFVGLQTIIASPAMGPVYKMVERVARTQVAVLVYGESGSGKEHVARAIHECSLRSNGPWVDLNCAALPENLIESELFGHEKGAFSGADSAKPGLFEMAGGGTIFLDEIGELDARMQVKLLRVLDGLPYYRVGGTRKVVADVRIVAATNCRLEEAMSQGRFRSDLFHRLSHFQIEVPPLRARREEIAPLAEHFLHQLDPEARLTSLALDALVGYGWPGNIRELRNAVTSAYLLAEDGVVDLDVLPGWVSSSGLGRLGEALDSAGRGASPANGTLDDVEKQMILSALASHGDCRKEAAEALGISTRTLLRKLKAYQMEGAAIAR